MTILPVPVKGGDILPWAVAVTGALATPAGPARGLVRSGAGGDAVEPLPGNARARRSSAQPLPFAVRIVAKEPLNEGGEPTKEAWIWLPDDSLVVNGQAVEIDCDAGAQADDDQAADALGGQWRKLDCYTGSAGKLSLDITLPQNQPAHSFTSRTILYSPGRYLMRSSCPTSYLISDVMAIGHSRTTPSRSVNLTMVV